MIHPKQHNKASVLGVVISVLAVLALLAFVGIGLNDVHQRLTGEINQLETELSETQARANEVERRLEREQSARQQAEASFNLAEDGIAQVHQELQNQRETLEAKIDELEQSVQAREQRIATAMEENARITAELARESEQRTSVEKEIASLREQVNQQLEAPEQIAALPTHQAEIRTQPTPPSPAPPTPAGTAAKMQFIDDEPTEKAKVFDTPPRPVDLVHPKYPRELRREGREGVVTVAFTVNKKGRVNDVEIQDASARAFADAAVAAVRKWRFKPAKRDGKPVEVRISQTLRFNNNE